MRRPILILVIFLALVLGFVVGRFTAPRKIPVSNLIPDREVSQPAVPLHNAKVPCTLVRVVDGDTIRVRRNGQEEVIQLLRINTPERGRPGYHESSEILRQLLEGREMFLEFETPGKVERGYYGRTLAYVLVDGLNVNVEMVRLGWSPFWTRYGEGRLAAAFREAEKEARAARRGLWAAEEVKP